MDPLSVAASVVGLAGACNQIAKGLNRLASLSKAPASIQALNNELADIRVVLAESESLLAEHKSIQHSKLCSPAAATRLMTILNSSRDIVEEVGALERRLTNRSGGLDRIAWLLELDNIDKVQKSLRTARSNIVAVLGYMSSKSSIQIESQIQEVQSGNAYVSQSIDQQNTILQKILENQQRREEMIGDLQETIIECLPPYNKEPPRKSLTSSSPHNNTIHFAALRVRFLRRRRRCEPCCSCRCHHEKRINTPRSLQGIIGQLFAGYTGFPVLNEPCDKPDACQGTDHSFVQINYYFPSWFLLKVAIFSMKRADFQRPEYSLRLLNLRNPIEIIFTAAHSNNATLVESLLDSNRASILDVTNDDRHSALHMAVKQGCIETAKVLMDRGADAFLENAKQETPFDMAWSTILCFQNTPNATRWRVEETRALFPSLQAVEERRQFTRVHKIVNQMLCCDLEKELYGNPALVNQVDVDGRTPLSYAAARGDDSMVSILLGHGADPNIVDRIGQGPLRQSMKASESTCTRLLLNSGADVDHRDNWDQTALISSAYYPEPLPFMSALLLAGADVNAVDYKSSSVLTEIMKFNLPDAVQFLLKNGANIEQVDHYGMTPFMHGIRNNSHEALRILLGFGKSFSHSRCDHKHRTALHWAAELGDTETLKILAQVPLKGVDVQDKTISGLTVIDIAEKRIKVVNLANIANNKLWAGNEWLTAFRNLLETIRIPTRYPSPASAGGTSDSSDEVFHDALEDFTFEAMSDLVEKGEMHHTSVIIA